MKEAGETSFASYFATKTLKNGHSFLFRAG